jgi:hypothetical protein
MAQPLFDGREITGTGLSTWEYGLWTIRGRMRTAQLRGPNVMIKPVRTRSSRP